ncbi:MAG: formate dehydrogenase accessory sulfurtransferase FdhD [Deltaproteobacteria bacterium]|nr:formate dehydrogenase accessory sulfurtransferase FdhD [Deltaproteobacteria bacterium]
MSALQVRILKGLSIMSSSQPIKTFSAFLVNKNGRQMVSDEVACEAAYRFFIDRNLVATVSVSPADLEDYAVGHVVTDGFLAFKEIAGVNIDEAGIHVRSKTGVAVGDRPPRDIPPIDSALQISERQALSCAGSLSSFASHWQRTGGLHIAVLFNRHSELIRAAEDVGRHNAVDKVVGYAFKNGYNLSECFLVCSGRQPEDMVAKVARAGIPVVISRAATTDRGIALADRVGLTLIGFAREDHFTIYTHPGRLIKFSL